MTPLGWIILYVIAVALIVLLMKGGKRGDRHTP